MFKNYVITAWRNAIRGKSFSLVNIAGLALGMAVFLFIMEYVSFEWSANTFNTHYNELYRVNIRYKNSNTSNDVPPGFAPLLQKQFPEIEQYARASDGIASGVISYTAPGAKDTKVLREDNMQYVDGGFFKLFSFPLLAGDGNLSSPNTIAISEQMSQKLFGSLDAVGKTITLSNQFGNTLYTIKSVYRLPATSDIRAEVLLSFQTLASAANRDGNDWADPAGFDNSFVSLFLLLHKNADATAFADKITHYVRSINPASKDDAVYLQPLKEMHLAPGFNYPYQTYGNYVIVVVLLSVALVIMLIAWVNYINLSTAQALNKAKEIGVRKTLGAGRFQLIAQYMTETLLFTLASAMLAIMIVLPGQHLFNGFVGKELSLAVLNDGFTWFLAIALIIVGSLLSGFYVAFVLTSFKPSGIIKGFGKKSGGSVKVRQGLVVFQFAISVVFIIATIALYQQLKYMQTENLGMNVDQLLVIQGPTVTAEGQAGRNMSFKNSIAQLPFVEKYAASNNVPGVGYNFFADGIGQAGASEEDRKKSYAMLICDDHFFDTYAIGLLQGRVFTSAEAEQNWNNFHGVIINEQAARSLGFDLKKNIIGEKINWGASYEIVGVVKDYHHMSLREQIKPVIYLPSPSYGYYTLKVNTSHMPEKISALKKIYNASFPGNPFEYFFADKKYDQQYSRDQQLGKVFIAAAAVAILISCMGLFGLAAFAARQRVKEIGIRKVLGAGAGNITLLLSKDFVKLVLVAIVVACPVAWWCMNKWLEDFAYRVTLNWTIFVTAGLAAVTIALVTVCFHTLKAATANPVESLRSE
ncbi:MAG: ABC transporter permease [Agriterribacter sp.]